jgi:hypothetical protein
MLETNIDLNLFVVFKNKGVSLKTGEYKKGHDDAARKVN